MKGKNPTRRQAQYIKSKGLNYENWLVCKDTPAEMVIKHKISDKYRTIRKAAL